jgi:AcrR family transcriptional regulator
MAPRPYTARRSGVDTPERILDAAEELVRDEVFHLATMEELARRAGVSRATLFTRFGSKLGVLEALSVRCAGGQEMRALRAALALEPASDALDATLAASCGLWEAQGAILMQLKAIVVLEPGASALVAAQRTDQRESIASLVERLAAAPGLAGGVSRPRAIATLHMLTSLEAFLELRREGGLSLGQTNATLGALARALLRPG